MGMISEVKLTDAFVKAFKEVVEPGLNILTENVNTLTGKVDVLQEDMTDVKERLGRVETRLEKIDDRLDRQGKVQDDLHERVETLEAASL